MTLRAVVIAAGVGSRLRPLTDVHPKPLLPIAGTPVLAAVLRELAVARCPHVTVVTGHLAEQVEAFVGDGSGWGLSVTTVRQTRPDGSADAVVAAEAEAPYLVLGADTVFAPGELARFAEGFTASAAAGALAVRRWSDDEPKRNGVAIDAGLVRTLQVPGSEWAGAPLWAVGHAVAAIVETRPGAAPYELATAFQRAIDAGERVVALEIGPTRDLTTPGDLLRENFPYLAGL